MALDPARLATAMVPTIVSAFAAVGAVDAPPDFKLTQLATGLAQGLATTIIDEFKNHAELVIDIGPPPAGTIK